MSPSQFLSDEWVAAVQAAKAGHAGNPVDQPGLVINATITDVPFGDPVRELHSAHGPVIGWEPGHVDDAVVSLTVDYVLARELVLDQTFDVLAQAVDSGRLRVDGDAAALRRWWRSRIGNPDALAIDDEVRGLTA